MLVCDSHVLQMDVYLYLSYELVLDDRSDPIDRSSNLISLADPFDLVADAVVGLLNYSNPVASDLVSAVAAVEMVSVNLDVHCTETLVLDCTVNSDRVESMAMTDLNGSLQNVDVVQQMEVSALMLPVVELVRIQQKVVDQT